MIRARTPKRTDPHRSTLVQNGGDASAVPVDAFAVLNRLGFGPRLQEVEEFKSLGIKGWLETQLSPEAAADVVCNQKLRDCQIRIRYPERVDFWPAMDELRPLSFLTATPEALMALTEPGARKDYQELIRPRVDVSMGTLIRAVYSRWQVQEVMVDFWHNHFNVNAWDQSVGLLFPIYDREVIRRFALGNFRKMLEAVAQSGSMLVYLNNRSSRTGAPNENYARELFELHTMGENAYLNSLYNRWRQVPGANKGHPEGYIDQDVYEAARAFTGWTLSDGTRVSGDQVLPRSGRFVYVPSWHDNYQKRILASEMDPYQRELADGHRVLDLVGAHPATARHLARKLCVRLVADEPSSTLVSSAAERWLATQHQDDQIAQVIRHIVLSRDFAQSTGKKIKRPLALAAGLIRELGFNFSPTEALINEMAAGGQRLFGWPGPNGHPETGYYWLSTNAMRRRWSLVHGLINNQFGNGVVDPFDLTGTVRLTASTFVEVWSKRLLGRSDVKLTNLVVESSGLKPDSIVTKPDDARKMLAWLAVSPFYQQS